MKQPRDPSRGKQLREEASLQVEGPQLPPPIPEAGTLAVETEGSISGLIIEQGGEADKSEAGVLVGPSSQGQSDQAAPAVPAQTSVVIVVDQGAALVEHAIVGERPHVDGNHALEPCMSARTATQSLVHVPEPAEVHVPELAEVTHSQALQEMQIEETGTSPGTEIVPAQQGNSGMTHQEAAAYARLKTFCSLIVKKLAPPLLKEVQASTLRPEAEPFTPKCTTRAAKRSATQSTAKATPAENVLLRTLGLVPEDLQVEETAVQELKNLFDSPLREQHVRVIAALFGKALPAQGLKSGATSEIGAH